MAATAGGVAVGSAVGHVVGHALIGGGGGGGHAAERDPAPVQQSQQQQENACAYELRQFLQCANTQHDLTLCEGFNLALRQCRDSSQGIYQ